MPEIKICGVTELENAKQLAKLPVSYIGLNFYPQSKRYIRPEAALPICKAIKGKVKVVGLFVDEDIEMVHRVADKLSLDAIQLHGDEDEDYIQELFGFQVWKAVRLGGECDVIRAYQYAQVVDKLVLDAFVPGAAGGTGKRIDTRLLEMGKNLMPKSFIAGGLTPENVREVVETYLPLGVDVASGIETAPGIKDIEKTKRFISEAS